MYKYMVFGYERYNSFGGMNDCIYKGNTKDIALNKIADAIEYNFSDVNILNNRTGEIGNIRLLSYRELTDEQIENIIDEVYLALKPEVRYKVVEDRIKSITNQHN